MGYTGRSPYLDNAYSTEGQKRVMQTHKPTHASRHRRKTLPSKRDRRIQCKSGRNGIGMKEDKPRQQWHSHKAQGTHYVYPTNTWEVSPRSRDLRGVVWQWGEKKSIIGFLLRLFLIKCFAKMAFLPKEVNKGQDHLMHAIEVGIESLRPLSAEGRQGSERVRNKTRTFVWKWRVVWQAPSEQR